MISVLLESVSSTIKTVGKVDKSFLLVSKSRNLMSILTALPPCILHFVWLVETETIEVSKRCQKLINQDFAVRQIARNVV